LYPSYFGTSRFSGKPYYGGRLDDYNHYFLFTAGGMNFIIVFLQYNPLAAQLDWADALLKANPDRRGIVVSHAILNVDDTWLNQAIYEALKDNPNLFLLLCGHMHTPTDGEALRSETFTGKTVHVLLSDYQQFASGGNGWLRILTFDPSAGRINVTAYSPYLDSYGTNFDLGYEMLYGDIDSIDCDVDGSDLAAWIAAGVPGAMNAAAFAQSFGRNTCPQEN
jgi:hypothetical protein